MYAIRSYYDRFFKNLRVFYQQRDAERDENLKAKIALCEAAEALSGSEDSYNFV